MICWVSVKILKEFCFHELVMNFWVSAIALGENNDKLLYPKYRDRNFDYQSTLFSIFNLLSTIVTQWNSCCTFRMDREDCEFNERPCRCQCSLTRGEKYPCIGRGVSVNGCRYIFQLPTAARELQIAGFAAMWFAKVPPHWRWRQYIMLPASSHKAFQNKLQS